MTRPATLISIIVSLSLALSVIACGSLAAAPIHGDMAMPHAMTGDSVNMGAMSHIQRALSMPLAVIPLAAVLLLAVACAVRLISTLVAPRLVLLPVRSTRYAPPTDASPPQSIFARSNHGTRAPPRD